MGAGLKEKEKEKEREMLWPEDHAFPFGRGQRLEKQVVPPRWLVLMLTGPACCAWSHPSL